MVCTIAITLFRFPSFLRTWLDCGVVRRSGVGGVGDASVAWQDDAEVVAHEEHSHQGGHPDQDHDQHGVVPEPLLHHSRLPELAGWSLTGEGFFFFPYSKDAEGHFHFIVTTTTSARFNFDKRGTGAWSYNTTA